MGTANLDNRSFRLNFEITMLIEDSEFCQSIETMFLDDFNHCVETGPNEYDEKEYPPPNHHPLRPPAVAHFVEGKKMPSPGLQPLASLGA